MICSFYFKIGQIKNISKPSLPIDVVDKRYVDDLIADNVGPGNTDGASLFFKENENFQTTQKFNMAGKKFLNLLDSTNQNDADTKKYVDTKPSVIAVNAESHGALRVGEYQFSFGLGPTHRDGGFFMPHAGIVRKALIKTILPTALPNHPFFQLTINGPDR